MGTTQPRPAPLFFYMDAYTRSRLEYLIGGDIPPAVVKRFDRIQKRVDAMGGASHPDPWVLALIAETANKPAKQQAIPKKKKVEVIPSA